MRRAIIICCHDGFLSLYCGVGTAARKTVEAIETLRGQGHLAGTRIDFIGPAVDMISPSFDATFARRTRALARSTGGDLHEIQVTAGGAAVDINELWGPRQWNIAAEKAADIIRGIPAREKLFFAHDIYFGQICALLPRQENVVGCYVPHSTGKLFQEPLRLTVEARIHSALAPHGHYLGAINKFMQQHLHAEYGIPTAHFIPLHNALTERDLARRSSHNALPATVRARIRGMHVIFSYGRCGRQKGYHILVPAFRHVVAQCPRYHLMLLAPTDISSAPYVECLEQQIWMLPPERVTWLRSFSDPIPYLQSPQTHLVAFPSVFECAPFTPLEALAYAPHATILHSGIQPFEEVFHGTRRSTRVGTRTDNWIEALVESATRQQGHDVRPHKFRSTYENNLLHAIEALSHALQA